MKDYFPELIKNSFKVIKDIFIKQDPEELYLEILQKKQKENMNKVSNKVFGKKAKSNQNPILKKTQKQLLTRNQRKVYNFANFNEAEYDKKRFNNQINSNNGFSYQDEINKQRKKFDLAQTPNKRYAYSENYQEKTVKKNEDQFKVKLSNDQNGNNQLRNLQDKYFSRQGHNSSQKNLDIIFSNFATPVKRKRINHMSDQNEQSKLQKNEEYLRQLPKRKIIQKPKVFKKDQQNKRKNSKQQKISQRTSVSLFSQNNQPIRFFKSEKLQQFYQMSPVTPYFNFSFNN